MDPTYTTSKFSHAVYKVLNRGRHVPLNGPPCASCGEPPGTRGFSNRHANDCKVWLQSMLQGIAAAVASLPSPTRVPVTPGSLSVGDRVYIPTDAPHIGERFFNQHGTVTRVISDTSVDVVFDHVPCPIATNPGWTVDIRACAAPTPAHRINNLPEGWRWMEPGEKVTAADDYFEDEAGTFGGCGLRLDRDVGYVVSGDKFDSGTAPGSHVGWCGYVRRLAPQEAA